MTRASLYAGPGKVYMSSVGLWPEGDSDIVLSIDASPDPVTSAFWGRVDSTNGDCVVRLSLTPFDLWDALAVTHPARITTPDVGKEIFTASDVPCKVWTKDGRLYTIQAAAVTKHPDLHLGNGKALFGPMEITGVIKDNAAYGAATAFLAAITETGGADPGGTFALTNFIRGPWTGAWGAVAGFTAVEAEDEWTVTFDVQYSALRVQRLTREMVLRSVAVMAKCRPVAPTHTQVLAAMKIQDSGVLGARGGTEGADLVLTGPSSKTVTINNAMLKTAGYEFSNGDRLGTGEIGFVGAMSFTAGAADALVAFSA